MKALVLSTGIAFVLALMPCAEVHADVTDDETPQVLLPIPDTAWDPDRPDKTVGWCAEASIQSALAYYGREVSQAEVNEAGEPDHPDLWVDDIDDALDGLGVTYKKWNEKDRDLQHFTEWIRAQLRQGRPVLCGVKIYPDENPKWSLDHFVLAVGFTDSGLILNTQPDVFGQVLASNEQLASRNPGVSFASKYRRYFARAITGVKAEADAPKE